MLDAGIDVPHACREGRRGSCARRSDPVVPVPAGQRRPARRILTAFSSAHRERLWVRHELR
nr:hypothetical protein [Mycobacterium interjectum]